MGSSSGLYVLHSGIIQQNICGSAYIQWCTLLECGRSWVQVLVYVLHSGIIQQNICGSAYIQWCTLLECGRSWVQVLVCMFYTLVLYNKTSVVQRIFSGVLSLSVVDHGFKFWSVCFTLWYYTTKHLWFSVYSVVYSP